MYRETAILAQTSRDISTVDDLVRIFENIHGNTLFKTNLNDFSAFSMEVGNLCGNKFGGFPVARTSSSSFASIAYMQNSYSDAAYRKFATRFKKSSASYFPGFREVCEDVYYGRSTHAIIPIYTSKDGQLLSFSKLILKYDLKIFSECNIEMNDDSVMRFALLQKGLLLNDESTHLDFSVILPDNIREGDFVSSLESLGGKLIMINSNPLEYSDEKYNLSLRVEISNLNPDALFLFLEGSQISYEIIGFYSIIN